MRVSLGRRAVTLGLLGVVLLAAAPADAAVNSPWTVVPTPNSGGTAPNALRGVAAISPTNAWAVGRWYDNARQAPRGQTMQWNGTAWQPVTSPAAFMFASELNDVDAVAGTPWAVGSAMTSSGANVKPFIMRYHSGVWGMVPSPAPGTGHHELNGIDMVTSSSGWAVGSYRPVPTGGRLDNLILRWDGANWTQVAAPNTGTAANVLKAVAVDQTGAWAVGYQEDSWNSGRLRTVILRWNGSWWQQVASPNPGRSTNALNSVTVLSPTDAWAVGYSFDEGGYPTRRPLALHWNGSTWTEVATADAEALEYTDVAAVSPQEVYLVGYRGRTVDNDFVMRWNGAGLLPEQVILPSTSNPIKAQAQALIGSALFSVAAVGSGQLWAVGHLGSVQTQALRKG